MFGLEKQPKEGFSFDLEKDLKKHPHKKKEMLEKITQSIHALKQQLREGTNEKDFEKLGLLLNGYTALQKVLTKINP